MNGKPLRPVLQVAMRRLGNPRAKAVLLVLAAHARDDGTGTWPSAPTIATELEISKSPVDRALAWLRKQGLIRQVSAAHYHSSPMYDLDLERLAALPLAKGYSQRQPMEGLAPEITQGLALETRRVSASDMAAEANEPDRVSASANQRSTKYPVRTQRKKDHADAGAPAQSNHREMLRSLEAHFSERTALPIPKPTTDRQKRECGVRWWGPLREIAALVEWRQDDALQLIDVALARMEAGNLTVAAPGSVVNVARAIVGEVKRGAFRPEGKARGIVDLARTFAEPEVIDAQAD